LGPRHGDKSSGATGSCKSFLAWSGWWAAKVAIGNALHLKNFRGDSTQLDCKHHLLRISAYSSDRGQQFHSDGGHHSTLMADSFSLALGRLPSMS
jgi:hypothetical protein